LLFALRRAALVVLCAFGGPAAAAGAHLASVAIVIGIATMTVTVIVTVLEQSAGLFLLPHLRHPRAVYPVVRDRLEKRVEPVVSSFLRCSDFKARAQAKSFELCRALLIQL
jgi:hypothetical protein